MKEEEAKTKWCPMVRHITGSEASGDHPANRWGKFSLPEACLCIGSDCMMWVEHTATNMTINITVPSGGDCGLKNRSFP